MFDVVLWAPTFGGVSISRFDKCQHLGQIRVLKLGCLGIFDAGCLKSLQRVGTP